MDVNAAIRACWNDHADDAEGVATRFPELIGAAGPAHAPALAGIVTHVLGEHLARWDDGIALLERLPTDGPSGPVLRSIAALHLGAGRADAAADLTARAIALGGAPESSHARVHAVAASAVAAHGRVDEAGRWLRQAVAQVEALPDDDPAVQSVAITGNNLACALEERTGRSAAEDDLLRTSARIARVTWERAGTWEHVERAEYRLAMTHLALGEPDVALDHARAALAVCAANDAPPVERFFPHEARARAHHARGDAEAARAARDAAAAQLAAIDDAGTRSWVAGSLAALDGLLGQGTDQL